MIRTYSCVHWHGIFRIAAATLGIASKIYKQQRKKHTKHNIESIWPGCLFGFLGCIRRCITSRVARRCCCFLGKYLSCDGDERVNADTWDSARNAITRTTPMLLGWASAVLLSLSPVLLASYGYPRITLSRTYLYVCFFFLSFLDVVCWLARCALSFFSYIVVTFSRPRPRPRTVR